MPTVSPPAKVLLTGANGFIAAWIVRALLEAGYSVRGTVRHANKGEYLKTLFTRYGDKLEIVVVEDLTQDGAFDEAVKGVDLVMHTASPASFNVKTPDDFVIPAIKGTVGLLESVQQHGSSVKRVVITSSSAALTRPTRGPVLFDESTWNEYAVETYKEKGAETSPYVAYQASKTLAERAAWGFHEKNKDVIQWDVIASILPSYPPIHVPSIKELNVTSLDFYSTVVLGKKGNVVLMGDNSTFVDVRDVAMAHVLAGEKPAAGGERITVSGGSFFWQEFLDIANVILPPPFPNLPKGNPGATVGKPYLRQYSTAKADSILGLKTHTAAEMVADTLSKLAEIEKNQAQNEPGVGHVVKYPRVYCS
ncbi:D-lactaldehyde dehydrogenase [Gloeopeniophorella convolvens]|nr:D-lactaldehyde dehydrogenase [Gloeopeniophorella convolvens]